MQKNSVAHLKPLLAVSCLAALAVWSSNDFGFSKDTTAAPALMQIASSKKQWTGVTVAKSGRVFVCYPRWSDSVPVSCAELFTDGSTKPYPDAAWNSYKKEAPNKCFVCVQSVFAEGNDNLWILDPAGPNFTGPVANGPKLMKVNLKTNKIERVYPFDAAVCPPKSYLNDVRIDAARGKAYMTDSGLGAIIVLDLKSGKAKRMLSKHASTQAENLKVVINGKPWNVQADGFSKKVASDGIALDPSGTYLYYHPLTGKALYKVPAADLANDKSTDETLANKVEKVADTGASDGIEFGDSDHLYLTSIEDNSIKRLSLRSKKLETLIQDKNMVWPDTLSQSPSGWMYVTSSQINLMPTPPTPYKIFKFKVDGK